MCLFVCFEKGTKKDKKYDFLDVLYGGVSRDIFCLPREEEEEEEDKEDKEEALTR